MPVISSFYGILIYIYYEDHNPPHFHAKYNEFEALFDISSLGILKGQLPTKAHSLVIEWAGTNREALMTDWNLAKANQPLNKIEPLR